MSITVHQGPAFASPAAVHSWPLGHEPYVRVSYPDGASVDAMATRWSSTHVLTAWEDSPGGARFQAWVPHSWARRIAREESTWVDRSARASGWGS